MTVLNKTTLFLQFIQVGGNSRAKDFFSSQPDIVPGMSLSDKYNSRAAALYRDKVDPHINHCYSRYMYYTNAGTYMYMYMCMYIISSSSTCFLPGFIPLPVYIII